MKLIIIGIDGGSLDIVNKLRDKLPTFSRLMEEGCYGILKTTIPPVTAIAWSSFMTGKNAGKHGVYDYLGIKPGSYDFFFVNRERIKSKTIFDYLKDKKICSINLPLTYPPFEINGWVVTGIDTPSEKNDFTWPKEFKEEINNVVNGYKIDVDGFQKTEEEILKETKEVFEKRLKLLRYMLKKEFDFFITDIRASDIVQHRYLQNLDKEENEVLYVYKKIDELLSEIKLEKEDILIVLSDHGFERVYHLFNPCVWFMKEGFLKLKREKSRFNFLLKIGFSKENIYKLLRKFRIQYIVKLIPRKIGKIIPIKEGKITPEEAIATGMIDWENTKAVPIRTTKSIKIYINTVDRPNGIVKKEEYDKVRDEIINRLKEFGEEKNIEFGIWKKEELYHGPYLNLAPDIIVLMKSKGWETEARFDREDYIYEVTDAITGDHNTEGMFIAFGEKIKKGKMEGKFIDVMPTILHFFGIKIPGDLDGKVLDIFKERRKVEYEDRTEIEKEKIREIVKKFGF